MHSHEKRAASRLNPTSQHRQPNERSTNTLNIAVMQESSTPHPYHSLDEDKQEIRLLTLHGRHENNGEDDTIRCSPTHASLEDEEPYEALSYFWGDKSNQKAILLDGHSF